MTHVLVPVAPGELIDKLTILRLKSEKMTDPAKLANVNIELQELQKVADHHLPADAELTALWDQLYEINADLWAIEDDIRACESRSDFGPAFIALARSVYLTNDERAKVKRQINMHLGSELIEEKSYHSLGKKT